MRNIIILYYDQRDTANEHLFLLRTFNAELAQILAPGTATLALARSTRPQSGYLSFVLSMIIVLPIAFSPPNLLREVPGGILHLYNDTNSSPEDSCSTAITVLTLAQTTS